MKTRAALYLTLVAVAACADAVSGADASDWTDTAGRDATGATDTGTTPDASGSTDTATGADSGGSPDSAGTPDTGGEPDAAVDADATTATDAAADSGAGAAVVVINEIAPAGDPDDWFELYNTSSVAADLSGWTFSDSPAEDPARAVFPEGTTLAPGAYLQVVVSDELVGFKLGSDEELAVFDAAGVLVDANDWDEGVAPDGTSWGRFPDGTGDFSQRSTPTPGARNEP